MTNEEKRLLMIDLCARLPYGVMVENILNHEIFDLSKYLHCLPAALENFKPYLRPMSSMTKEERLVYEQRLHDVGRSIDVIDADDVVPHIDWLISRHFDYRGLIPMGLALEATEGMYKTEYL